MSGNSRFDSNVFGGPDFVPDKDDLYFPIQTSFKIVDSLMMVELLDF
jgi:hypothetical protein